MSQPIESATLFQGHSRIGSGPLPAIAALARSALDREPERSLAAFDDHTGRPVELDLRGTLADVMARYARSGGGRRASAPAPAPRRPPGRPRLGVVGREVTLLPRHWDWLNAQPGGASVTLRRLVEQARRAGAGADRRRRAQEAAYAFMAAIAGDLPGFEEATRALFAGDPAEFAEHTADWPADVAEHAAALAREALSPPAADDR